MKIIRWIRRPLVLVLVLAVLAGYSQRPVYAASMKNIEELAVWRLRVRIYVSKVDGAGTDDDVWVRFKPHGVKYYLNYSYNDFEQGSHNVYDVVAGQVGVNQVKDITEFTLGKAGDDGLNIKRIEIFINASMRPIFVYQSKIGRWLDNENGHHRTIVFKSATLRFGPLWTATGNDRLFISPRGIPRSMVTSVLESGVGNMMHGTQFYWAEFAIPQIAGPHVWYEAKSATLASVTLKLAAEVTFSNPGVNISFDLTPACTGEGVSLTASNVTSDVDYSWTAKFVKIIIPIVAAVVDFFVQGLGKAISQLASVVTATQNPGSLSGNQLSGGSRVVCSKVEFDGRGDLLIKP